MPSRLTVPVDSVDAGPAPLLTDITMPSVMPMSAVAPAPAVPPPPSQQNNDHPRRRGSDNSFAAAAAPAATKTAPTSIIRNKSRPRDASTSRGGRVTFAGDTRTSAATFNDQKSNFGEQGRHTNTSNSTNARSSTSKKGSRRDSSRRSSSSQRYQSDRYQRQHRRGRDDDDDDQQVRERERMTGGRDRRDKSRASSSRTDKTPSNNANANSSRSRTFRTPSASNRLNTTSASISTTSTTSSSTRKNENVCRNRLESALRDQFDTSFTGSQGLSTLIGRKDMPDGAAAAAAVSAMPAVPALPAVSAAARTSHTIDQDHVRDRENVAPNDVMATCRRNKHGKKRDIGPNERKYKERHAPSVDKAIARHRRDRPDRPLRDYRTMNDAEKEKELNKVGSLLARLGIADNFSGGSVGGERGASSGAAASTGNASGAASASGDGRGDVDEPSAAASSSYSATSQPLLNHQRQPAGSRQSSRVEKDLDDSSRTTMDKLSNQQEGTMDVDDSRTTANGGGGSRSSKGSSRRDVEDSRTTMGSQSQQSQQSQPLRQGSQSQQQRRIEIEGNPSSARSGSNNNNNSTVDDSRTTMGDGNGSVTNAPNDTTACSSTRMDQSSMVFDFGGSAGGTDGAGVAGTGAVDSGSGTPAAANPDDDDDDDDDEHRAARWSDLDTTCSTMRTPENDGPRRRGGTGMRANNNNDDNEGEDSDDSDEIDSPREQEEQAEYGRDDEDMQEQQYQQGITRMEDSHFTCNADAGTVAETQGGISVARPKLLFQMQTPQFERGGSNKQGSDGEDSLDDDDDRHDNTTRSGDTTAQSGALLSNNQGSAPKDDEGNGRTPSNRHRTSCSPVELPRSAIKGRTDDDHDDGHFYRRDDVMSSQSQSFQSPVAKSSFASSRKRLATTSGKRGADQQRSRIHRDEDGIGTNGFGSRGAHGDDDDDIMGNFDDGDSFGRDCPSEQIDSPSQMNCSSIPSPPSEFEAGTPSFLAEASQSPILQCGDDESMNYEQSVEFRRKKSPPLSSSSSHRQQSRRHGKQGSYHSSSQRIIQASTPSFSQQTPAFSNNRHDDQSPAYSQFPAIGQEDDLSNRQSPGLASPIRDMSIDDFDKDDGSSSSEERRQEKATTGKGARWRAIDIPDRGRGNSRSRKSIMDDTVESVNCTVLPRRDRNRRDRGKDYSRDVAPADIHLKKGESYRLDPLRVRRPVGQQQDRSRQKRRASSVDTPHRRRGRSASRSRRGISRSPPTISFPDPLSSFDRRTADKLEVVTDWLVDEDLNGTGDKNGKMKDDDDDSIGWYSDEEDDDNKGEAVGRGIVISCTLPQIVGVALKLLVTNGVKAKSTKRKRSPSPFGSQARNAAPNQLNGGTLIVLRDKEDLPEWEQVLRERTCYSVMNHASMSSAERKRSKIAGKCSGFQVVLTTYDALKAKESSYALDDIGRALHDDSGSQGGWMASRSQSNRQSCEHLSVLHQLTWHRVLFMDVLGRQSYTCKPSTARFKAVIALNAKSRFIFFEKEKDGKCILEDIFKESRKQLCAVATALHLPEEDAAEYITSTAMLDFREIQEIEGQDDDVDESRYDDISSVEDSDDTSMEDGQQGGYDDYESSRCHSDSEVLMSPIARRRY